MQHRWLFVSSFCRKWYVCEKFACVNSCFCCMNAVDAIARPCNWGQCRVLAAEESLWSRKTYESVNIIYSYKVSRNIPYQDFLSMPYFLFCDSYYNSHCPRHSNFICLCACGEQESMAHIISMSAQHVSAAGHVNYKAWESCVW